MKAHVCAIVLAVLSLSAAKAKEPVTQIEIWSGAAHDGLAQKLVDALRQSVSKDASLHLAPGNTSGSLKILIPNAVRWARGTEIVTVSAEFSIDGASLGQTTVACTQTTLGDCATAILRDARRTVPAK